MIDKKYVKATKLWLKTQELCIQSCDLNIQFHKKQIALLRKSIKAEQYEKNGKIMLKNEVINNLKNHIAKN